VIILSPFRICVRRALMVDVGAYLTMTLEVARLKATTLGRRREQEQSWAS